MGHDNKVGQRVRKKKKKNTRSQGTTHLNVILKISHPAGFVRRKNFFEFAPGALLLRGVQEHAGEKSEMR